MMTNQKFFLKMQKNSSNFNFVSKKENLIKNFYSNRHLSIGNNINAVGWSSKKNQYLRFQLLTSHIKKHEKVLDYGCGFCDMYFFFKKEKKNIQYYGYDLYDYKLNLRKLKLSKRLIKNLIICCSGFTYKIILKNILNTELKIYFPNLKSLALNFLSNNKYKTKKIFIFH